MKKIFSMIERKMAHSETGGVRTTEDESEKLETSSEDEEIMIPSQDKAEARNLDIRDEHSENTTTRRLPTTYGALAWGSPETDWCGAPAGYERFNIEEYGGYFWDPPSATRKTS